MDDRQCPVGTEDRVDHLSNQYLFKGREGNDIYSESHLFLLFEWMRVNEQKGLSTFRC